MSMILCFALLIQLVPVFSASAAPGPGQNVITTILEENDSRLTYEGAWSQVNSPKDYHGGKSAFSADRKAAVSTSFTGTGFRYTGTLAAAHLPLEVWIDGALHSTIVTKSNSTKNKQTLFETMDLPYGAHDVRILVAGGNTGKASSNIISLDRIEFIVKVLAVPEGVSISQDDQNVTVSWRSATSALSYNVYRSIKGSSVPVKINDFPITSTRFVDEEVKLASIPSPQTINYQVSAVGDGGIESELSPIKSINLPSNNVKAPSNLKANVKANNVVSLSWKAEDSANGYRIYRSDAKDGVYELIGDEFLNPTNSFTDLGVQARFYPSKASVYYKISAVGQFNESALTSAISVTMNATQGPANLLIDKEFDDVANQFNVSLQWTSVAGAVGYRIYQLNSTGKLFVPLDNEIVVGGMTQFTVENRNLSKDSKNTYAVTAVDSTGKESAFSRSVEIVIPKNTASTPKNFRASNVNNIISLSWSPSASAVGYKVFRSSNRDSGYTLISGAQLLTNTTFVDSSFAQLAIPTGKQYFYKIHAVNRFGEPSTYTHHVTVTRRAPSKPQPVDMNYSDRLLKLQWPQVAGAVQYKVYTYVKSNNSYSLVSNETVTSNSYQYQFQDKHQPTDLRYYYAVSARDNAGNESSLSNKVSLLITNTVPGVPSQLKYVNNNNAIKLSWTASKNAVGYNIYRSASKNSNSYALVNQGGPINANEFVDLTYAGLNVQSTVKAYYKVTAVNRFNVQSQQSSILTASFMTPQGPSITSTELVNDHLTITWNPVQGAKGYVLSRSMQSNKNFVPVANLLTTSSYDDYVAAATFNADTTYYYMVKSIDALGQESKNSSVASAKVLANTASIPTGVTAAVYNSNVTLNWTLSSHAAFYNVYKKVASGTYVQLATGVIGSSYSDTVITNVTTDYMYAVSAVNPYGTESAKSEQVIATVEPLSIPQNLSVASDGSTANLTWEAIDGVTEYRIYRSTQAEMGFTRIGTTSNTNYGTQLVTGTVEIDFIYYYAVSAVYPEEHESALSNIGSAAVSTNIASAPSLNNYSVTISHQVTLNWEPSDQAVAYNIYRRSITDNTEFTLVNISGPVTGTSFVDTQLSNSDDVLGDSFGYIVKALNAYSSESIASNELQVLITAPIIPVQVTASVSAAGDSVTVNWLQSEGAIGYRVYRSNNGGDTYTLISTDIINGLSYEDSFNYTIQEGLTLEYAVTAIYHPTFETQKSTVVQAFIGANAASIPESVTVDWLDNTSTVKWSPATNAIGYKVYRQQDTGNYQIISGSSTITDNSFVDETLAQVFHNSDTEYHYAVSATNQYNTESQKSDAASLFIEASPKLQLAAICSIDPVATRTWRVRNDNAFPLTFTLKVVGSSQSTEYTIDANAEIFVDTIAVAGTNTARILVNGVEHALKENVGAECAPAVTSVVSQSSTTVVVTFGGPVEQSMAEDISSYTIYPVADPLTVLSILSAVRLPDPTQVRITTGTQIAAGVRYGLKTSIGSTSGGQPSITEFTGSTVNPTIPYAPVAGNILANPEFELYSNMSGVADSWAGYSGNIANSVYKVSNTNPNSGYRSQVIEGNNLSANESVFISQLVLVTPGKPFTLSGKFYAESLSNSVASIFVNFYNQSNQTISSSSADINQSTNGYVSLERAGKVPAQAETARVYAILKSTANGASGKIHVDSMMFAMKDTLLINDSFEIANGNTGLAEGWAKYISAGATDGIQIVNTPVHSGNRAQKVSGSNIANGDSVMVSQLSNVESGKIYNMSGQFLIESLQNSKVQLFANFYNASNQVVAEAKNEVLSTNTGYTLIEKTGVVPVGATSVRVYAILKSVGTGASGTFYVDNLSFNTKTGPLVNLGFETYTGNNGVADGWAKYIGAGAQDAVGVINTPVKSGSRAQKVSGSNIPNADSIMVSQLIPLESGKLFYMSAQFMIESLQNSKVQLFANFYNSANQYVGEARKEFYTTTTKYIPLEVNGAIPANATSVRIYAVLRAVGAGASGTFYVDDMVFNTKEIQMINSGMEISTIASGVADGWSKYVSAVAVDDVHLVSSPVFSGTSAQKVSGSNIATGDSVMVSQLVPVESGKSFQMSGKFMIESLQNSKVQLFANFYNASNEYVGEARKEYSTVTTGFVPLEVNGTIPATATTVRVYAILRSTNTGAAGTFYVDDIKFVTNRIPLVNSGFEVYSGSNGVADGWSKLVGTGAIDNVQVVNSPVFKGNTAQKIAGTSIPAGDSIMISQLVPVVSGDIRQLTANINVSELTNSKFQIYVNYYNSTGQLLANPVIIEYGSTTSNYIELSKSISIPEGALTARVYLILRSTANLGSGTIYADDVNIN